MSGRILALDFGDPLDEEVYLGEVVPPVLDKKAIPWYKIVPITRKGGDVDFCAVKVNAGILWGTFIGEKVRA